ncbi:hypothetical protein ACK9YZ_22975 [Rhizobium sp. ZK1]|uniref:hypothetical protein n=1 Tax=Rhizobium sp. ZK1 TaxID=3389872 RepID=UPI0039F65D95
MRQSAYERDLTKIAAFGVLPSSEAALADAGRDGYAGCISGDRSAAGHRHSSLIPALRYRVGKCTGNVLEQGCRRNCRSSTRKRLEGLDALRPVALVGT